MPALSQRTLAHVIKVLRALPSEDADTFPLIRQFWQELLFKWGFPPWLIDHASGSSFNWVKIIRDLFAGEVTQKQEGGAIYHIPRILQESMLNRLTVMAITESEASVDRDQLRRSLQLDGFEVSKGKTIPIEGPVSVTEERSRLLTNLGASRLGRKTLIAKHLEDAEDFFSEGKMHPAMGQARSALQAGVEDTVSLVENHAKRRAGGGFVNQIEFLMREGFISADEQQAFLAGWGFLSAGAHPGLPPDEAGRVGLILGLEFMQMLLVKAKNLL